MLSLQKAFRLSANVNIHGLGLTSTFWQKKHCQPKQNAVSSITTRNGSTCLHDVLPGKKADLVVFDKDGTLICFDTAWRPYLYDLAARIEKETGIAPNEDFLETFGFNVKLNRWVSGRMNGTPDGMYKTVQEFLHDNGHNEDQINKIMDKIFYLGDQSDAKYLKPFHDLPTLFKTLKLYGVKTAICTGDSRLVTSQMVKFYGLETLLDMIVCGDDPDTQPKPSPYNLLKICKSLDISPSNTVIIGDSTGDIEMGKRANAKMVFAVTCGVCTEEELQSVSPDYMMPTLREVVPYLLPKGHEEVMDLVTCRKGHLSADGIGSMAGVESEDTSHSQVVQARNYSTTSSAGAALRGSGSASHSRTLLRRPAPIGTGWWSFPRRHYSSVANKSEYDYVIIGTGSAGSVLANRLSAEKDNRVLVLENGGRDTSWKIHMPAAIPYTLFDSKFNWCYYTLPQKNMDGRSMYWPRGKMWGGCSSHNAMVYIRGNALDYDRWEEEGATGWSYADCLPYFKKAQTHELGEDDYRGGSGPLYVSRGKNVDSNPLHRAFIDAGVQAGYPYTEDMNGYQQEGFGYMDMTIKKGVRANVARMYLRPVLDRKNLATETHALVTRILFEGNKAVGVEYKHKGQVKQVRAEKEVILSAGAINSPQILNLSGIGNADDLKALNIPVVNHLPGVGENLQDHLDLYMQHECTEPITLYKYQWKFPHNMIKTGLEWFLFQSGAGASAHLEAGGFIRSRPGIPHPDLQYHFLPSVVIDHGKELGSCHAFQVHVGPMRSTSRGYVKLKSKDPAEFPIMDPKYLDTQEDIEELRYGVRLTREIFAQKAFDRFRGPEIQPGVDVQSDAEIDAFVRAKGDSAYHPSCTNKIGSESDKMAVVDPACRVYGMENLRVVDASVMPSCVSGNLNGPTVMIAEKAADIILGKSPLPRSTAPVYRPKTLETQR